VRELDNPRGRLARLLDEGEHDHDPTAACRYVECAAFHAFARRAHFPQLALNVLNMRFADAIESEALDAVDDPGQRGEQLLRPASISAATVLSRTSTVQPSIYHLWYMTQCLGVGPI
jgi:hypothetical protein